MSGQQKKLLAIAGIVLGIIGIIYFFIKLLLLSGIVGLPDASSQIYARSSTSYDIFFVGLIPILATSVLFFWLIYKKR